MKVILCTMRRGKDADFIFSYVPRPDEFIITFALEEGKKARKRKLKMLFKGRLITRIYILFLTLPVLFIYDKIEGFLVHKHLKTRPMKKSEAFHFDDVNDDEYIDFVSTLAPDIILNYGTAIYKLETLKKIKIPIVNFHTGILPAYRNVHTDFWAYVRRDIAGLGVTAFVLNEEIDAGVVLLTQRVGISIDSPLWMIKVDNLWNVICQMSRVMASVLDNSIKSDLLETMSSVNEIEGKGTMWKTPAAHTLLLFGFRQLLHNMRRK